MSINLH